MSDPPGMKRSHDDSTSPNPKRHNTEQSNIPCLSLEKEDLKWLKAALCRSLKNKNEGKMEEDQFLDHIYNAVQMILRPIMKERNTSIVDKNVFKTNFSWEKQDFDEVMRRAVEEVASEQGLQAVVSHSMCTRYGTDRVMN
jgi:hypothetical protein